MTTVASPSGFIENRTLIFNVVTLDHGPYPDTSRPLPSSRPKDSVEIPSRPGISTYVPPGTTLLHSQPNVAHPASRLHIFGCIRPTTLNRLFFPSQFKVMHALSLNMDQRMHSSFQRARLLPKGDFVNLQYFPGTFRKYHSTLRPHTTRPSAVTLGNTCISKLTISSFQSR